jgi:hypothetical protein
MSRKKDAVFFAHSFDKETHPWSKIPDAQVAAWFEELLSKRWRVLSGKLAEARSIGEKVTDAVDDSKAIVALFTRRHKVESGSETYLPSPWLLCECSYALGRFKYQESHTVAGFREKGVEPSSLAMLSIGGMEFPEFDREQLERDRPIFNQYLDHLERRILTGPSGQGSLDPDSYVQTALHKIFLIYRNGFGTVHSVVDIVIKDADRFMVEHQGKIHHRLWTHYGKIPNLAEMLKVPVHMRKNQAFFHGMLDTHRNRRIETSLDITETGRKSSTAKFSIRFMDANQQPLKVKANDTLRYQYAWGIPGMFPVNEEDLPEVVGDIVDNKTYCLAELDANHGKIDRVKLELRFEREARDGQRRDLFSKSPFVRTGRGPINDTDWGQPRPSAAIVGDPAEFDMWYERYAVEMKNFEKRIAIAWRPSSKKYQL